MQTFSGTLSGDRLSLNIFLGRLNWNFLVYLLFQTSKTSILESVTIKDIAKALNISTSTVSRALRGSYEISPETKKLVIEYAESVNYRPNPIALSLKENRSRSIGVIVPEIANHFFSQAINGIEAIAYNRGYHVVIFQSHESYEREVINVAHVRARKVDGLIISLAGDSQQVDHLAKLQSEDFPLVFFDRVPEELIGFKVVADNYQGAYQATQHLIQQGRKRIAHMTSPPFLSITRERLAGYQDALRDHNLPFDESLVRYLSFRQEEAFQAVHQLIHDHQPDAFLTASDRVALNCFAAIKETGKKIPEEVAFIGFSNLKVANLLDPSLSTVVQPAVEMGQSAAELVLDIIEKKNREITPRTVVIPTEVIVRNSSR